MCAQPAAGAFVLGLDSAQIATSDAYAKLDKLRATATAPAPTSMHHNDLEPAACALVPALEGRLDAMRRAAGVAFIAGSGPSVVGVAIDEANARKVAESVRETFARVLVAEPSPWGVRMKVTPVD